MRSATLALLALLLPAMSSAQTPCTTAAKALGFDPYSPSDLAIVRNYGAAALVHAPLGALLKLDPYVPSEAALLRQVGGGLPVWWHAGYVGHPVVQSSAPCEEATESQSEPPPASAPLTTFRDVLPHVDRRTVAGPSRRIDPQTSPSRGITVEHDGRLWVSAGPAVPFIDAEFVRVGERAGSPIFRRNATGRENVIYIPTTPGMAAPFRRVR